MRILEVTQNDLQQCSALFKALMEKAKFSDVSLAEQDQIKQAVQWLGMLGRELGQSWQEAKKPIVPRAPEEAPVVSNPKRIGKRKGKK